MQRNWKDEVCPVACALSRVGDMWSLLILRDAISGLTRFEEFQNSLNIATNVLSRRLVALVDAGLLAKRRFREKPARYDYVVTETGLQYRKVILALLDTGKQFSDSCSRTLEVIDTVTGHAVEVGLVDRATGIPVSSDRHRIVPGAAAPESIRYRFDYIAGKARASDAGGRYRPPDDGPNNRGVQPNPQNRKDQQ